MIFYLALHTVKRDLHRAKKFRVKNRGVGKFEMGIHNNNLRAGFEVPDGPGRGLKPGIMAETVRGRYGKDQGIGKYHGKKNWSPNGGSSPITD